MNVNLAEFNRSPRVLWIGWVNPLPAAQLGGRVRPGALLRVLKAAFREAAGQGVRHQWQLVREARRFAPPPEAALGGGCSSAAQQHQVKNNSGGFS
ncbi:MAG TPA: hypothetical protein VGD54_04855 [Steroidobacteraceae bacterium]